MNIAIEAQKREIKKKSDLTVLRNEKRIPAIIYKQGQEGLNISLEEAEFARIYRQSIGEIAFFDIKVDGNEYKTVIKEKQIHPVTRKVMHIDFQEVIPENKITMKIPLKFIGEPHGIKEGGELEILVRNLHIKCLPKDIPEEVKIDISPLGVGESIHFSDLKLEYIYSSLPGNTVLAQVKGVKK